MPEKKKPDNNDKPVRNPEAADAKKKRGAGGQPAHAGKKSRDGRPRGSVEKLARPVKRDGGPGRTKKDLEAVTAKYRALLEDFPLGVSVTDAQGRLVEANGESDRLLGRSRGGHDSRFDDGPGWTVIRPDGTPMPADEYAGVRAMKERRRIDNVEMGIVREGGAVTWISASAVPLPLEDYGAVIAYNDITERRRAEEVQRESQEKYRLIVEHSGDNITLFDMDLNIVYVSPSIERLRGYTVEEVMRQTMDQILLPHSLAAVAALFEQQMALEADGTSDPRRSISLELEEYCRDGSTVWVEDVFSFIRDDNGAPTGILSVTKDITDRKRQEQEIRDKNRFLDSMIEQSPNPIWISDEKGTLVRLNAACCDLLRITPEEVVGRYNVLEDNIVDEQGMMPLVRSVFEEGRSVNFDLVYDTALLKTAALVRSARVMLNVTIFPVKDDAGRVRNAVIQHVDITERRRAEEALSKQNDELIRYRDRLEEVLSGQDRARLVLLSILEDERIGRQVLRQSEERYRHLVDVMPLGVAVHADGKLLFCNSAGAAILGAGSPDELKGRPVMEIIHPDNRREAVERIRRMLSGEKGLYPVEDLYLRLDGTAVPVEVMAVPLTYDDKQAVQVVVTDISGRKRSEEALRLRGAALENAANAIVITDRDGIIEWANKAFMDLTGYDENEVIGKNPGDLVRSGAHDRDFYTSLWSTILDGRTWKGEIVNRRKNGTLFQEDMTIAPVLDDFGRVSHFVAIKQDITDRKMAEAAIAESEEKHRTLFETMAQGVVYQAADGSIVSANPAAEAILGLTLDQMMGRTSMDPRWKSIHEDGSAYPGDDHPAMIALRTGREVRGEIMGVYNPGLDGYRWISINAIPQFRSGEEHPFQVYTTFADITDLKNAEQLARFQLQFLYIVINAIKAPIFFKDVERRYVGCNAAFEEYVGHPMSEIIGKNAFDLWPRDLAAVYDRKDRELLAYGGEQVYESQVRFNDGSWREVLFNKSIFHDKNGALGGIVGVMLDITDRKRAEEAVRESERFALGTVNALGANIAIIEENGVIVSVNSAWRSFAFNNMRDPIDVFEGVNYLAVCDTARGNDAEGAAEFAGGIRAVMKGEMESYMQEYPCHSPDERRWFIGKVNRFQGEGPVRVVISHTDITGRKIAEERITASLQEKDVLLREIHHRVKNNMQVISSLIGLQSSYLDKGLDVRTAMNEMQNRIKSMAIVHERLYRSENFARINFREYITSLSASVFQSLNVDPQRIGLRLDVGEVTLGIDEAVPCGLLVNELITNALKHGFPAGNRGSITVSMHDTGEGGYRISVADDGAGLPEGFSGASSGSLGMRLIGILTRQIGGTLDIRSGRAAGAEFVVTFPAGKEGKANEG